MMSKRVAIVVAFSALAVASARELRMTEAPAAPSYYSTYDPALSEYEIQEVKDAFATWNDALATGDPYKVADLYTDNGILLPTVSSDVRTEYEEIADYFKNFLVKNPVGTLDEIDIRLERVDRVTKVPDVVSMAGIYTFTFDDGSAVSGRYTYVYKRIEGVYKILIHHSSELPETHDPNELPPDGKYLSRNTTDPTLSAEEVQGILSAFDLWNEALQTGDPYKVVDLYEIDSVLVPTVSGDIRCTQEERVDYFVKFLENEPYGELLEYNIRIEGLDAFGLPIEVSNSGIYQFTFNDGLVVQGRYTYMYVRVGLEWRIKHHHSSQLPEVVVTPATPSKR